MSREERKELLQLLKQLIAAIHALQFGNYSQAEFLCRRTEKLLAEHFPGRKHDFCEVSKINFRSISYDPNAQRVAWDMAFGILLANAYTMMDELILTKNSPTLKRKVYATICLFVTSCALWSFNGWLKWQWLTDHSKRPLLYTSVQIGFVLVYGLVLTNNKKIKFIEIAGLILSLITFIFSML